MSKLVIWSQIKRKSSIAIDDLISSRCASISRDCEWFSQYRDIAKRFVKSKYFAKYASVCWAVENLLENTIFRFVESILLFAKQWRFYLKISNKCRLVESKFLSTNNEETLFRFAKWRFCLLSNEFWSCWFYKIMRSFKRDDAKLNWDFSSFFRRFSSNLETKFLKKKTM